MQRVYNILLGVMWSLIYFVIGVLSIANIEQGQTTRKVRDFNADMWILFIGGFFLLMSVRVLYRGLCGRIRPAAA